MDLVGDRRGQSIQIGAILLFAALIIAFASYQAFVVPNQNRGVEFNHNQQVQSDMQDLRNAIVSARGTGESRSVSVQLGTRYPSRLAARNPSPPSGSLNTVGTTDESVALQISNAQAAGETGDFWNESQRYNTGGLTYRPNYNVYANPPTTIYEQTVLYNQFRSGNITLSNQSFIDGTDISLVAINGSVAASSTQATSVDVQSVSSSTQRIRLENDDSAGPITITFTSRRSAAYWDFLETTQSKTVANVSNTSSGNGFYNVSVELRQNQTYSLQLTKVGVGSGATNENAAYLTDINGDGSSVSQGETTELTLEVRDRFNNPPADAAQLQVNGSVVGSGNGELERSSRTPDADGKVTFTYDANGSTGEQEIQFSYTHSGTGLNTSTPQNVSMTVDVTSQSGGGGGGGGGAYALSWQNTESGNSAEDITCSAGDCTWDVGNGGDSTLNLEAGTTPTLPGLDVTFLVNNSTVGTPSSDSETTDSNGEVTTDLTASESGTVGVFALSQGASDVFNLTVENVSSGGGGSTVPTLTTRLDDLTDQETDQPRFIASYNISGTNSSFERVEVMFANQNDGSADDTQQQSTTQGGLQYDNNYGTGDTYDVTYDVIYTIDGTERVVTSETITDVPDSTNPSGNTALGDGTSGQLTSWEIEDRSNNGQGARYDFSYQVDSGSFSEVQYGVLNLPNDGSSARESSTSRSQTGSTVNPSGAGYESDYRLYIVVRDANGAVVDSVSVEDNADGAGTFSGP